MKIDLHWSSTLRAVGRYKHWVAYYFLFKTTSMGSFGYLPAYLLIAWIEKDEVFFVTRLMVFPWFPDSFLQIQTMPSTRTYVCRLGRQGLISKCTLGASSMWSMVSSDMIFTSMASHIGLLLRVLQVKIRRLGADAAQGDRPLATDAPVPTNNPGYYQEIVNVIKIHQRLIRYFYFILIIQAYIHTAGHRPPLSTSGLGP